MINVPYTAFGLIVVESIWPNKDYGYAHETPMIATKEGGKEPVAKMENSPNLQTDTRVEYTNYTGEAHGYYRLIPMNVTGFSTTCSVNGENSFTTTFTMDDIILVGGNPSQGIDGLRAIIPDVLSIIQNSSSNLTLGDFNKLRSLGLAAHRIGSPSSLFSIEDIVQTGDTVSIWFYNDPQEFPAGNQRLENSIDGRNVDLAKIPQINTIIGAGNRTAQYTESDDEAIEAYGSGSDVDKEINRRTNSGDSTTSPETISTMLLNMSKEAISYSYNSEVVSKSISTSLDAPASSTSVQANAATDSVSFKNRADKDKQMRTLVVANDSAFHKAALYASKNFYPGYAHLEGKNTKAGDEASADIKITYGADTEAEQVAYFLAMNVFVQNRIDPSKRDDRDAIAAALKSASPTQTLTPTLGSDKGINMLKSNDLNKFMAGKKVLEARLKKQIEDGVGRGEKEKKASKYARVSRATIATEKHGETGYMIFKGHIVAISSKMQVGGAYEVTLSGNGLDYPLQKHMIFYENGLMWQGDWNRMVDLPTAIEQLSPARAMMFLINRWMPREIIWGPISESTAAKKETKGILTNGDALLYLRRGNAFVKKTPSMDSYPETKISVTPPSELGFSDLVTFSPIHFENLTRLKEMINAMTKANAETAMQDSILSYEVAGNTSVWQNIKKIAGAPNVFEFFVDEIGALIYRPAGEAWERASQPIETPIIFGDEIQTITYSRSEETVSTLIDVSPAASILGAAQATTSMFDFGRAFPKLRNVPINSGKGLNSNTKPAPVTDSAPELYRYGMRYQQIPDYYGANVPVSRDKAHTILAFYKDPLKKAEVTILGNPSFRVGNTVIIHNPDVKRRSNALLNCQPLGSWINGMTASQKRRFLSPDERLNGDGTWYHNNNFSMIGDIWVSKEIVVTHDFIAEKFVKTFDWLGGEGFATLPADLFPTTLWYYLDNGDSRSSKIISAYKAAIKVATGQADLFPDELREYLRYVRFNNFLCQSYYIETVSHSYHQMSGDASTRLSLSYGQDNIVLIHPVQMIPIGYMSVERKMMDDFPQEMGSLAAQGGIWRKFLHSFFEEQDEYKASSFLMKSQKIRNTANYLNKLAYRAGKN